MKKLISCMLALALVLGLCACGTTEPTTTAGGTEPSTTKNTVSTTEAKPSESNNTSYTKNRTETDPDKASLRIYSLKGPTSMGLAAMLRDNEAGSTRNHYVSTICTTADEVTAALVNGDADVALLPANAAATLFSKTSTFSAVAINTLGVLYIVENGDTVHSIQDLAGKTVCLTGKGTTPEYTLRYLLAANGIEDQVTLEFKSEAQEVVAAMTENVATIGLLPQPFVTAAMAQNENLRMAVDMTKEWDGASDGGVAVTGVTVVRNEILVKQPEAVEELLKDCFDSVDEVNNDPAAAAELIVNMGIVAKAPIAEKAIPYCNLVCITGDKMKTMLSAYLQTLYDQNPKAVGGAMPVELFYYTGE